VELGQRGALVEDRHDDRHADRALLRLDPLRCREDLGTRHRG
jgi:hypothetical protein